MPTVSQVPYSTIYLLKPNNAQPVKAQQHTTCLPLTLLYYLPFQEDKKNTHKRLPGGTCSCLIWPLLHPLTTQQTGNPQSFLNYTGCVTPAHPAAGEGRCGEGREGTVLSRPSQQREKGYCQGAVGFTRH